jgi:hypothetical protein
VFRRHLGDAPRRSQLPAVNTENRMTQTRFRLALALAAGVASLGAAHAATPPADLVPTTDAAVTYAVQMTGKPSGSMSIAWDAESGKMRVESLMFPGWLLLEPRENRASMVVDAQRVVMQMPGDVAVRAAPRLPSGAQLSEAGEATVAGQRCTLWDFTSLTEGTGTLCVTEGKLMLRTVARTMAGEEVRIEAETVSTSPQEEARFKVPDGYAPASAPRR